MSLKPKHLWPVLLLLLIYAAAEVVRYRLIETSEIAFLCDPGNGPWWCAVRRAIVLSFTTKGIGWASLGLGVVALSTQRRVFAITAMALGIAGLVLYCWDTAAIGFLLGLVTWTRTLSAPSAQRGHGQQHA